MAFTFSAEIQAVLEKIQATLPADLPVYMVGGAVRDLLLQRETHDLDFILPEGALKQARRVADALGGAYYPLDSVRAYGRVILARPGQVRLIVDIANIEGGDLEDDLRGRDFTINAMALELRQLETLIDPLGGLADLRNRRLRAGSPQAFENDPLRVLRGVRLAAAFECLITPETRGWMRQAAPRLSMVSAERLRNELFRILETPRRAAALRALDTLGALAPVLPELEELKGVTQPPPHIYDVWEHSLEVVERLETVLAVLATQHDPELSASLHLGMVAVQLGRFRGNIQTHLQSELSQGRTTRALLFLSALYHDIAKPRTRTIDPDGRTRFFEHEELGVQLVAQRAAALQLSKAEILRLERTVRQHLRPLLLAQTGRAVSRRAIYRFFRDAGPAGVDVCLLSLADVLGTYVLIPPQDIWARHIEVIRVLVEAWWEKPEQSVAPPALVTGHELMKELELEPGPLVGELLEAIREAQASGKVRDRKEALNLARVIAQGKVKNQGRGE
ncbi:MAG TPA: HD domain-containing protein [Anaerolineales bacterium]|nr:HD domain-containing protein [Anaerolineales bacterium]